MTPRSELPACLDPVYAEPDPLTAVECLECDGSGQYYSCDYGSDERGSFSLGAVSDLCSCCMGFGLVDHKESK